MFKWKVRNSEYFFILSCLLKILQKIYFSRMNPCVKADPESEFTLMYACPYCDRVFTAMFYYERHIFLAHPRFNPFVCKLCKKKFKNETDRQNHVCLVSGNYFIFHLMLTYCTTEKILMNI